MTLSRHADSGTLKYIKELEAEREADLINLGVQKGIIKSQQAKLDEIRKLPAHPTMFNIGRYVSMDDIQAIVDRDKGE